MSIDPTGYTLAHEHLHIDLSGFKNNVDCRLDQYAFICQEMNDLMTRGVRNVIEMTNRYMGRNAQFMLDVMRGLGFVPLIATTALATGVYAVAGFTFVYAVGYLSPNPMVAAVLGAVVISAEVLLLRSIGKWLGRYPSVRNASDNIRNAMNMLMEVALLVGSIFAAIKMAGYTGFSIAVAIYFLNESLGRPVQKMAAPVVAVMITGILLNVLYWLGLFVPA
ncbi:YhfT family protein [Escherichia coli]|uniref:YhfT family protein n=1 Tax=Escherichia coli TaxID=562 RepID=UPI0021CCA7DE|nr:YhfT family protein [Escherichia coli]